MSDLVPTNRVKELAARFNAWEAAKEQRSHPTLITVPKKKIVKEEVVEEVEEREEADEGEESSEEESEQSEEESEEESEESDEAAEAEDEEQAPKPVSEVTQSKETDQSNVLVTEDGDEISKFKLPESDIEESAKLIGMPVSKVKIYNTGVQAYAFVKQNSGMLKPVKLFFQPKLGRLFIVRKKDDQIHSLYIHVDYFEEIDCQRGGMGYLARNTTDQVLLSTVTDLEAMPHMVLWTNDKFNAKEGGTVKSWFRRKKPASRRSLVFIFEDNYKRDVLADLLLAAAAIHPVKSIAAKKASDYKP